jgi:hypothetical protein
MENKQTQARRKEAEAPKFNKLGEELTHCDSYGNLRSRQDMERKGYIKGGK